MLSVVLRDMDHATLSSEQLRTLLLYAEHDIHDSSRQAVAFGLLKSVLQRKLAAPELHSIMEKVTNTSYNHMQQNLENNMLLSSREKMRH